MASLKYIRVEHGVKSTLKTKYDRWDNDYEYVFRLACYNHNKGSVFSMKMYENHKIRISY